MSLRHCDNNAVRQNFCQYLCGLAPLYEAWVTCDRDETRCGWMIRVNAYGEWSEFFVSDLEVEGQDSTELARARTKYRLWCLRNGRRP